jgi:hypothetical protein
MLIAVVAGVLLSGCRGPDVPPRAATVDGTKITQEDLAREADAVLAVTPANRAAVEGPNPTARIGDLNRFVLTYLMETELVERYAAENGIQVDPQDLQTLLDQIISQAGGQRAVSRQLAQRHLAQADIEELARQAALRQALAVSLDPNGDAQAQGQALQTWLVAGLGAAEVEVNPRFGVLDEQSGQVVPITSTDELG